MNVYKSFRVGYLKRNALKEKPRIQIILDTNQYQTKKALMQFSAKFKQKFPASKIVL
jgi:hypothetical protein